MGDVLQGRGQRRLSDLQHGPVAKAFLRSMGMIRLILSLVFKLRTMISDKGP